MAFRDSWHTRARLLRPGRGARTRTTTTEEPYEPEAELEDRYRERPNVRRLSTRRRRDEIDDIFADDDAGGRPTAVLRPGRPRRRERRRNGGDVRVHLVHPQVASTTPSRSPTGSRTRSRSILNLQGTDTDLVQAPDRLRQRPDLRARRRHAADRRQGLHAHAAQRRDLGGGARAADREGLLQPVLRTRAARSLR